MMDEETPGSAEISGSGAKGTSQLENRKSPFDIASEDDDDDGDDVNYDENRIVRHIMVVGFHHKHGYQVDYCYPPLTPGGPVFSTPTNIITLPPSWKTLPLLCLPDGSHNYDSDTIYFTMPDDDSISRCDSNELTSADAKINQQEASEGNRSNSEGIKTIFGTACYRQIQVDKLRNRTDDMTRLSVQKSVCVLSTQPLFGLIRSKLEMITHAYFEELDFSKVRILRLTYDNLNSLLARDSVRENATFLGLSARRLVSQFGCNMLVLFKAMLLEKKILFYKSPVRDLCSTIISMCSLFPGLLECNGLDYSTCDLQLSSQLLEALKLSPTYEKDSHDDCESRIKLEARVFFSPSKDEVILENINSKRDQTDESSKDYNIDDINDMSATKTNDKSINESHLTSINPQITEGCSGKLTGSDQMSEYEVITQSNEVPIDNGQARELDLEVTHDETIICDPIAHKLCQNKPEECGLPLQIFTRGSFCLPYLSLSYLDLLSDTRVRSFVIGATNILFKQRREMYDVIVDMEENTIIINSSALKRNLSLTIEDLRFMDYLTRHVNLKGSVLKDNLDPINHDITRWIGGDEWISGFVSAWKQTSNNYRIWDATGKWNILDKLQAKHPFSSDVKGINFSDMKLKLNYAVNSSEKGKIVNQTLTGIGKWSIWNNLASASNIAATTVSTLANSAAAQTNLIVSSAKTTSTPTAPATTATSENINDGENNNRQKKSQVEPPE